MIVLDGLVFPFFVGCTLFVCLIYGLILRRRRLQQQQQEQQLQQQQQEQEGQLNQMVIATHVPQAWQANVPPLFYTYSTPLQGPQEASTWGLPLHQRPQQAAATDTEPQPMYSPPSDSVFVYGQAEYIPRPNNNPILNAQVVSSTNNANGPQQSKV
ncbi:hypothetical protein BCY84_10383 [Trypanosoma cruzi cruzi]|nr:hypothetical protein BCY84_10388 [Trypanosoma cruzi cruzi]PBJ76054.1 hypothetical protein BCY84_10383 [Trypanosoma cruzi cruzi]